VSSITGGSSGGRAQPRDYTSVNSVVGADSSERSPAHSVDSDPSSLGAVLATEPERPVQSSGSSGYRSANAIVGADGLPQRSSPVVEVREGDGFDWFDALIGALIASGLTLITLVAGRTVARHRRATAESRA
jgi:hypothetical protein